MSTIDGQISGLNKEVYDALKKIKTSDGITREKALSLKTAIQSDGKIDAYRVFTTVTYTPGN